jgi:polysaccharide biosynthesis transport protein
MTFAQLFSALKARWPIMAASTAIGTLAALGYNAWAPSKYLSNAVVVLDSKASDPIGGGAGGISSAQLATQFDIIRSDRVARMALQRTGMLDSDQLRLLWQQNADGKGSYAQWASTFIKQGLKVQPSRESNVIAIGYEAVEPRMAAALANAFAQAYVDVALDLRISPAKRYAQNFDESLVRAKQRLDEARAKLSAYEKEHDLVSNGGRYDIELARLTELQQQVVMLQSASADSDSRASQSRSGQSDRMAEVMQNSVITGIKANLVAEEARLRQISSQLGDAHPQVTQGKAVIAELKSKLDREVSRVADSVVVSSRMNKAREADVFRNFEKQRQKVIALKETHDTAAVLAKEVESAEHSYDSIAARLNLTTLEGQASLPNVNLLSAAEEPSSPTSPIMWLNVLVGFVLSTVLGVMTAFYIEMRNRRVRSEADLEEVLGEAPMISIAAPSKQNARWSFLRLGKKKKPTPENDEFISRLATPEAQHSTLLQP